MNETTTPIENIVTVPTKPYEFRKLSSVDVFPMFKILGKIGMNEFTDCFEKDAIKKMISSFLGEDTEENVDMSTVVGISVVLEIANVVFSNLPKCENEIYQLLSQTSNLTVQQVKALDFVVFAEMVIDFIQKEEFKDFIKVVSKLFR